VQDLFQEQGAPGRDSGRDQGKLVTKRGLNQ
jgi:hypothetical protein